jgi:spermidine/putrescine-binding protein
MSADDPLTQPISRRRFLTLAGGAAGSAFLAACGGGGGGGGAGGGATGAQTTGAGAAFGPLEDELNVLNWGGYIDFAIKPFEKKYGVKVNIEHYGGETEAFAKVKANPGRYDTFNVGVGYLEPAVAQGLVEPIDVEKLPSYKLSYPEFQPGPFEVNGKVYGVAYAWGTNAYAYSKKAIPEGVDSWAALWDTKYKGKTSLVDKGHDQFLTACLYLGIDFNNPGEENWPKIKQAIIDKAKNMRTLWSSGDDLQRFMVQGDVILADCYDGLGHSINAKDASIVYHSTPKEGTYGWFDGPELLANAPHPNAALAWIDFVTSTEIEVLVAKEVNYAPANTKVPDLISAELRETLNLQDPGPTIQALKFWKPLGPDWDQRIEEAWAEAKAA